MAVALQYATRWKDPAVIALTILPVWNRQEGPGSTAARVGLMSIWGRATYPEVARVPETPTKRKTRAPRPKISETRGSPHGGGVAEAGAGGTNPADDALPDGETPFDDDLEYLWSVSNQVGRTRWQVPPPRSFLDCPLSLRPVPRPLQLLCTWVP